MSHPKKYREFVSDAPRKPIDAPAAKPSHTKKPAAPAATPAEPSPVGPEAPAEAPATS
jgi:hypothetical protein